MKRFITTGFVILVFFLAGYSQSPKPVSTAESSEDVLSLDQELPIDTKVVMGKLENGVNYYIRENKKPEKRAELRLVVNTGSVLEDDNQQGLAHLLEHMAFNGSEHFEKQELVDFLELVGMRFGPDLNAYTSFDETVYILQIPTDSLELVETAFQILEDWAHGLKLDEEEIDKERGVVIEEWRLGRGAEARMRDKQFPILFKGSKYANRLPIGKKAVVDTCHYETLRKFYRDWYRPDLMAVVAVGDFDVDWVESLISTYFNRLIPPEKMRTRETFPVPGHEETLFAIATDREATVSRVAVYYKQPLQEEKTVGDYRRNIVHNLYNEMLNQRLDELKRQADSPFLYGYSHQGQFVRSGEVYILMAGVQDNGIEKGLDALLTEAKRVDQFGFTSTEMERAKKELLRWIENAYDERDKTESRSFTWEYVRHYLTKEPIPGIEYEYELYGKFLPTIELEEVNQLAREWLTEYNRVIMVNAPEKEEVTVPDEEQLLQVFINIENTALTPYEDTALDQPLVSQIPIASEITSESYLDDLDLYKWELANGVRVLLKPTDFKNDEILFSAYSPGGHSLVAVEDHVAGMDAADVVRECGVGSFSFIELEKLLAGKRVRVSPYIHELYEGFSGSASPQDMETMFQLIYLYFTVPRQDSTAFLAYKERLRGFLENRSARPESAFRDTIKVTLSQHHPRRRPWSVELLEEMNLEMSYTFFQDRFADAGDFSFIFVGNFDLEVIRSFVETYLGGLPAINREESWQDVGVDYPKGIIEKVLRKGMEPKSMTQVRFTGDFEWNSKNRYVLSSMIHAFRIKLREVLREDMGGTYGVGIWGSPSHYPEEEYDIGIVFGCDPERVEELTDVVFMQIDSLKTIRLTEVYLNKVKEAQRRERETNLKENKFWLNILKSYDMHGENLSDILRYDELVESLTLEDIQKAAQKFFNVENYVQVTLFPEELTE